MYNKHSFSAAAAAAVPADAAIAIDVVTVVAAAIAISMTVAIAFLVVKNLQTNSRGRQRMGNVTCEAVQLRILMAFSCCHSICRLPRSFSAAA